MASIEIYNDDNYILLGDGNYPHRLIANGVATSVQGAGRGEILGSGFVVTLPISVAKESMPILAVRPLTPGAYFDFFRSTVGANSVDWVIATAGPPRGAQFEWFAFQDGLSSPLAGTGMVVLWDADGTVTFDSDANYAVMRDFVEVPVGGSASRNFPAGRKYAVAQVVPAVRRVSGGPGGGYIDVMPLGCSIDGEEIKFQHYCERPNGNTRTCSPGSPVNSSAVACFMVFDITGLGL